MHAAAQAPSYQKPSRPPLLNTQFHGFVAARMHLRVPASSSRLNLRSALLPEDIFGRSLRASPPPYAAARGRPAADIRLAAGGEAGAQVAGAGDEDDETDTGDGMPGLLAAPIARAGLLQRERVRSRGRGRQDPFRTCGT